MVATHFRSDKQHGRSIAIRGSLHHQTINIPIQENPRFRQLHTLLGICNFTQLAGLLAMNLSSGLEILLYSPTRVRDEISTSAPVDRQAQDMAWHVKYTPRDDPLKRTGMPSRPPHVAAETTTQPRFRVSQATSSTHTHTHAVTFEYIL